MIHRSDLVDFDAFGLAPDSFHTFEQVLTEILFQTEVVLHKFQAFVFVVRLWVTTMQRLENLDHSLIDWLPTFEQLLGDALLIDTLLLE